MCPKPTKIPVRATPNIDNVLLENYSRPRLRIMVTKNNPKKLLRLKLHIFFAATTKILTKI